MTERQYYNTSDACKYITDAFVRANESGDHVSNYERADMRTAIRYMYRIRLIGWTEMCLLMNHLNNCIAVDEQ